MTAAAIVIIPSRNSSSDTVTLSQRGKRSDSLIQSTIGFSRSAISHAIRNGYITGKRT